MTPKNQDQLKAIIGQVKAVLPEVIAASTGKKPNITIRSDWAIVEFAFDLFFFFACRTVLYKDSEAKAIFLQFLNNYKEDRAVEKTLDKTFPSKKETLH